MLVRNEQEISSVHSGLFFIVYGSFIKEKVGPGVQRLFGHNLRAVSWQEPYTPAKKMKK